VVELVKRVAEPLGVEAEPAEQIHSAAGFAELLEVKTEVLEQGHHGAEPAE
jgi:hypothetical protein